jgi:hypothetical protein
MKQYTAKKLMGSMDIDGNLDKKQWQNAEEASLYDTVTGSFPRQRTSVKLMWNENFLYAAFKCDDTFINASMREFNDPLYNEEVVEIFIDDDHDMKSYIEIEVNPLNAILHYFILNDLKRDLKTYARLENDIISAVRHVAEQNLICFEIAIPMSEFPTAPNIPPKTGDRWLINMYRIDRPSSGNDEYSAWSPTGKLNFHVPERFGEIIFED